MKGNKTIRIVTIAAVAAAVLFALAACGGSASPGEAGGGISGSAADSTGGSGVPGGGAAGASGSGPGQAEPGAQWAALAAPILEAYKSAASTDFSGYNDTYWDEYQPDPESAVSAGYLYDLYLQTTSNWSEYSGEPIPGCAWYDLDGNGTPELIIGIKNQYFSFPDKVPLGDPYWTVEDIWTVSGGAPARVLMNDGCGYAAHSVYLSKDGWITVGPGGDGSDYSVYLIGADGKTAEAQYVIWFQYMLNDQGEPIYTYYHGDAPDYAYNKDAAGVRVIEEGEFRSLLNECLMESDASFLDWKPL